MNTLSRQQILDDPDQTPWQKAQALDALGRAESANPSPPAPEVRSVDAANVEAIKATLTSKRNELAALLKKEATFEARLADLRIRVADLSRGDPDDDAAVQLFALESNRQLLMQNWLRNMPGLRDQVEGELQSALARLGQIHLHLFPGDVLTTPHWMHSG